jgi:Pyridoxamine 5'-phosphate oxidase
MRSSEALSWPEVRDIVRRTMRSSLHSSIASINDDGSPHVTPIGSLMLTDPWRGLFFEVFTTQLLRNLDRDPRLCVLAVDSRKRFWLESVARGRFGRAPAVRLTGTAGARRDATLEERARFERAVRPLRGFKGHGRLWGNVRHVRDIEFEAVLPVRLGAMTRGLPSRIQTRDGVVEARQLSRA